MTQNYCTVKRYGLKMDEHRHIAEMALQGIPLTRSVVVHHYDHNKKNNDPGNLEIVTRPEHGRLHSQLTPEESEAAHRKRNQKWYYSDIAHSRQLARERATRHRARVSARRTRNT